VDTTSALWYAVGLALFLVGLALLATPLGIALRVLFNGALGGLGLWVLNLIGGPFGLHLALNPVSAATAGLLGVPGVAFLGIVHWLAS